MPDTHDDTGTDLLPPHVPFHVYDHLPLDVDDATMTTLGVPVGDLPFRFAAGMTHNRPTPVGQFNGTTGPIKAYPVFATWGFLNLEWPQAAALARAAAHMMGVSARGARDLPGTHLVARLLHASFPSDVLTHETARAFFWDGHVERVLDDAAWLEPPCKEYALIERVEAADLARHLARHLGRALVVQDVASIPHCAQGALLRMLVDTAAPKALFGQSAHAHLSWPHTQNAVLVEGRDALPGVLRADRHPLHPLNTPV